MSDPAVAIKWATAVAEHDYDAARNYLSLSWSGGAVDKAITRLQEETLTRRRANDILRASGLEPAALDDPGVVRDLIKVIEGKRLSPILVVKARHQAVIADGFHRVSLVYQLDPYATIPLKLA